MASVSMVDAYVSENENENEEKKITKDFLEEENLNDDEMSKKGFVEPPEDYNFKKPIEMSVEVVSNVGRKLSIKANSHKFFAEKYGHGIFWDGKPFQVKTPWMITPFGINEYTQEGFSNHKGKAKKIKKFSVSCNLDDTASTRDPGSDERTPSELFYAFMTEVDYKVEQWCKGRQVDENRKNVKPGIVRNAPKPTDYSSLIRKSDRYSPTMKIKIPVTTEHVDCVVWEKQMDSRGRSVLNEMNLKPGDLNKIVKGSKLAFVVEFIPVWENGTYHGTSAKAIEMAVDVAEMKEQRREF